MEFGFISFLLVKHCFDMFTIALQVIENRIIVFSKLKGFSDRILENSTHLFIVFGIVGKLFKVAQRLNGIFNFLKDREIIISSEVRRR